MELDLARLVRIEVDQELGQVLRELDGVHHVPEVVRAHEAGELGVVGHECLQQALHGAAVELLTLDPQLPHDLGPLLVQVAVLHLLPLPHDVPEELLVLVDLLVLGVLAEDLGPHQALDPLVGRQAALVLGVEREAPASGDARVLPRDRAEELLLGLVRLVLLGLLRARGLQHLVLHGEQLLGGGHAHGLELGRPGLLPVLLALVDQGGHGLLLLLLFVEEAEGLRGHEAVALGVEVHQDPGRVPGEFHLLADVSHLLHVDLDAHLLVPGGSVRLHGRQDAAEAPSAAGLEELALLDGLRSDVLQPDGGRRLQAELLPQLGDAGREAHLRAGDVELVLLHLALPLEVQRLAPASQGALEAPLQQLDQQQPQAPVVLRSPLGRPHLLGRDLREGGPRLLLPVRLQLLELLHRSLAGLLPEDGVGSLGVDLAEEHLADALLVEHVQCEARVPLELDQFADSDELLLANQGLRLVAELPEAAGEGTVVGGGLLLELLQGRFQPGLQLLERDHVVLALLAVLAREQLPGLLALLELDSLARGEEGLLVAHAVGLPVQEPAPGLADAAEAVVQQGFQVGERPRPLVDQRRRRVIARAPALFRVLDSVLVPLDVRLRARATHG
mmetsp:Transcript_7292/g.21582  ORF Transcript_7292/g.21582 Transcript_7292/m.21582 type:complete len:617 (-) Transcript_7292:751-2601(-)